MVCAGRSGELNRAFEVLTMMQQRGMAADAATYGSLIESCVCAGQPEKALRVFEVAMAKVRASPGAEALQRGGELRAPHVAPVPLVRGVDSVCSTCRLHARHAEGRVYAENIE
jgi:pentatricopeptide repeat protein